MEPSAPQFVDVQRWEMDVPWPMTVGTLLVRPAFGQACILNHHHVRKDGRASTCLLDLLVRVFGSCSPYQARGCSDAGKHATGVQDILFQFCFAAQGSISSWSSYNTYRKQHPTKPDPLMVFHGASGAFAWLRRTG
jgi:hypothetical protein